MGRAAADRALVGSPPKVDIHFVSVVSLNTVALALVLLSVGQTKFESGPRSAHALGLKNAAIETDLVLPEIRRMYISSCLIHTDAPTCFTALTGSITANLSANWRAAIFTWQSAVKAIMCALNFRLAHRSTWNTCRAG